MRTDTKKIAGRLGHIGWLSGALMLTMATNDDGSCGTLPATGTEECRVASDCDGRLHASCEGSWSCEENACDWTCATQCRTTSDCGQGQVCRDDGRCVGVPVDHGCFSSNECGNGQHCNVEDGVCHTPPGCDGSGACPAVCYGECVSGPVACRSDDQCQTGEACVNGQCQPASTACYGDDQCGVGSHCDFTRCFDASGAPADPSTPSGDAMPRCPGTCVADTGTTCGDGTYCAPGNHCVDNCTGVCPPCDCAGADCACPCYQECKSSCVPDNAAGCTTDEECGEGFYCGGCGEMAPVPNGIAVCMRQCLPKETHPTCTTDWDCADGQVCELVACTASGAEAPACDPSAGVPCDDRPAPPPPSCWGYCATPSNECSDDSQCSPGFTCQFDCGATDASGAGDRPYYCPGHCAPSAGGCASDLDCVSPNGQLGTCTTVCEASASDAAYPCDPSQSDCGMPPPPPECKSYCEYPNPTTCDPTTGAACAPGYHCESACNGFAPDGDVACIGQCVPDQAKCDSNCGCAYGEQCVNGLCEKAETFECSADWTCPDGYTCGCAFTAGFGVACFPQCIPSRPACCSDAECGDGNQCVDGQCQPWTCGADGTCPDGYECTSSCPVPMPANGLVMCQSVCTPKPGACKSDCDCPSRETCGNGECHVTDAPNSCYPTGCTDDSMCAPGQQCLVACPMCLPGEPCPPCQGSCVDQPACKQDADCAPGQYCKLTEYTDVCTACADGSCDPTCTIIGSGYCADQPTPTPCGDGTACGDNETCACMPDPSCPQCDVCLFQCVPKEPTNTGCQSDADCKAGEACNTYYPPCACPVNPDGTWGPCPSCTPISVCEAVTPPPDPNACKSDVDCAAGERCDLGACGAQFVPCTPDSSGSCTSCTGTCVAADPVPTSCVVTGCSGQICADQPTASTCEYRDWYQCYKLAKCEDQADGRCGFTPNDEFKKCLEQYGGLTTTP